MQTDFVLLAADRMYDAIRDVCESAIARDGLAMQDAIKRAACSADDYDAAISQIELDERQRSRICGLRPHDVGRN